ncbi:multiple epidermal growth factor-like domains protein 10 isoform X1 [Dreissena polymorpha]|uniref:multiple epidermal growth factor-like domains protein 10 isoform X1 n=2 Tax=Dreissena polymorpha TaxID=45954 RepID=UPI002264980C|nr:multiple epidermal growth factor-like domains protein 10 isoform X1 [Dreissena polymorpha]XP_052224595.1 multiple epidermal growth factor-like domains protein 10 isoform X1 [Dreissena polymorpha]
MKHWTEIYTSNMDKLVYMVANLLSFVCVETCPPGYGYNNDDPTCQKCLSTGCMCTNIASCKGCLDGYFMKGYLCSPCPARCLTCTNTSCTSCKHGYTGANCDTYIYANGNCLCESPWECDSCVDGYYDVFSNCTYQCNHNCSSCLENATCESCKPGMYGADCRNVCSKGCNDSTCNKTDGSCSCKMTFTGITCDQCNSGWYGSSCDLQCSVGCNRTKDCNQTDGSCMCSEYFIGEICDQCKDGRYGISCEHVCSSGCNTTCNQSDGTCSCLKNFTGDLCNECLTGMYGESCELNCSRGCNGKCNRTDGNCTCLKQFTGALCDECKPGWYGNYCKDACLIGCSDICHQTDGTCKCLSNFTGAKCDSCLTGIYGLNCTNDCSDGCVDHVCNRTDGSCTCEANFEGDNCERCVTGKYGYSCETSCSNGCVNHICNRTDGRCTCLEGFTGSTCDECIAERYGSDCSQSCSQGCADGTCNGTDGSCRCSEHFTGHKCDKCNLGKYGSSCEFFCSQGCVSNECNRNGNCLCSGNFTGDRCDRCILGKYGEHCNFECPSGCLNHLCNHNGECSDGCLQHFFGNVCNQTCHVNCKNGTSNSTRCERATGSCRFGCYYGFSGNTCETIIETTLSEELHLAAIAGGAGGGLIAICVIGLLVFCRLRKKIPPPPTEHDNLREMNGLSDVPAYATVQRNNCGERNTLHADVPDTTHTASNGTIVNQQSCRSSGDVISRRPSSLLTDEDGLVIDEHEAAARLQAIKFEERGGVYYNCASKLQKSKIRISELLEFVDSKDQTYFDEEFEKLPKGMTKKYDVSQMSLNMPMNRYNGVYPYDDSRVIVHGGVTDYINASYIDGYKQRNAYIATLGPTSKQLGDFSPFWRMIWQQKVDKIVMVTNFVEEGKDKCDQYFPDVGLTQSYGEIFVKCTSKEEYAEFVRRIFSVFVDNEHRTLYHLHFTAWPDKDIPEDVTSIVEFRTKVLNAPAVMGGPTVVHCSAGIGRSGTYIALDILIREGEAENMVDIPGCVVNMRHNRPTWCRRRSSTSIYITLWSML